MANLPLDPHPPALLRAFNEFLQERVREGLTASLREVAEKQIKQVVDEALSALETQIHAYHDISRWADVFDVIVRTRKDP